MRFSAYSYTNISDVIENAVSSFHTEYYQSTSNTELIGGKWSSTIPPWENGKYYWQKTITTFSDTNKAPIETKPVCVTGGIGSDGRGIKSIVPEYAKNTSGTTAPISGWSSARPTWNQREYIWTRFKITYNDGSNPEYTTPTCDSSWEAMNNLEIGGRNLLKSTSSITGYKPDQRNWNWGNWGTVLTNTTDSATDSIHIITPGGDIDINSGVSFLTNDIKYQKGEKYTFSVAIRGTYNPTDKFVAQIWYETTSSSKYDSSSTASWIDNQDGINDGISSVIFQRRFISFTIPEDFDEDKNKLRIVISCKKMDILLCRPQLEKGNKPTDWKRAEEDIQEQFTSVISSVSGVKSIVDKINGQITNKIWVTDINNTVNEYDNTKIKTIRDQVALQEQTLSGFNQTVKDMQTTIATKADGSTVETIKNNVSSLTQDLSGFKTTVSQTYATNDNLQNNYFTKSETQQLADKIYWIVSDSSTSSSLTLTSQALTAMTNQFVVKSPDGKHVVIQNGQILLDALKSNNYSAPTTSTGVYAAAGTFYDLSNGSITSKNFVIDSNGNVYLKGTVYATNGSFTGDIIANSLTLGSNVSISSSKITGLSSVATSGKYTDLAGTPNLTVYIQKDGVVGSMPKDGVTGFTVSSSGLLSASNAVIYGTVYASAGMVGGCNISNGLLEVPAAHITGQLTTSQISSNSITSDKLSTNALKSKNYIESSDLNSPYSESGTFYDLSNGSIISKNFILDSNGNVAMKGKINATSGTIGKCFIYENVICFLSSLNDNDIIKSAGFGCNEYAFFAGDKTGTIITDSFLPDKIIGYIPNVNLQDTSFLITYDGKVYSSDLNIKKSMNIYNDQNQYIPFVQYIPQIANQPTSSIYIGFLPEEADSGQYIDWSKSSGICFSENSHDINVYGNLNLVGNDGYEGSINCSQLNCNSIITLGSILTTGIYDSYNRSKYLIFSRTNTDRLESNIQIYAPSIYASNKVLADVGFQTSGCTDTFKNNILWNGSAVWPTASQTCTFSQQVSKQPHGIVLVFRGYNSGVQNADWHSFFISKQEIANHAGQGRTFFLSHTPSTNFSTKYIYISDGKLTGHDNNSKAGTGDDGVKYDNNRYALQYVIGV